MVAATLDAPIRKRFITSDFAPPSGYSPSIAPGSEVTAEEILSRGVDESDWSFPAVLSTERIDRQQDSVIPEGCDYADFARNCVVFFDHQTLPLPIGTMRSPHDGRLYLAIVPGKGIIGRVWIYQPKADDKSAHAENCRHIWQLVKAGLLNGLSLGFDPKGPVKSLRGGGNLYNEWLMLELSLVAIPANPDCLIIREPARLPSAIFKRLNPAIRKSLSAWYPQEKAFMTTACVQKGEHDNTRDIKFNNGKWELLDDKTRKVLSTHDTREEALGALRAIEMHKHGKSAAPGAEKDMNESSGADGGYTVPEEEQATRSEICKRMDDNECKGHYAYYHPGKGELRHVHPADLAPEKVKSIAGDIHDIPGVKSLVQTSAHPKADEGFHKVYEGVEKSNVAPVRKSAAWQGWAKKGKEAFRQVKRGVLKSWAIERAVKGIMPTLKKAEVSDERAIAIAWGIAAERKGYGPLVAKAADVPDDDEDEDDTRDAADDMADDAATDAALDVPEDEAAGGPDGLELVQTAIENLEAAIPRLEPERREFWQGIIEQIRDHGEEIYPDEDFGGEDTKGKEGAAAGDEDDAKEQEETDEMLARYKSGRPKRIKRISVVKVLKSLQKSPEVVDTLHKVGNHLHSIAGLHPEFHAKTGDCVGMKGYTAAMHKACSRMGRDVDRVIGAIGGVGKGEKPHSKPEEDGTAQGNIGDDFDMSEIGPIVKSLTEGQREISKTLYTAAGIRRPA